LTKENWGFEESKDKSGKGKRQKYSKYRRCTIFSSSRVVKVLLLLRLFLHFQTLPLIHRVQCELEPTACLSVNISDVGDTHDWNGLLIGGKRKQ